MKTHTVRPWRLAVLLGSVLLFTAYLPHPKLGEPLPQSLNSLVRTWMSAEPES